VYVNNEGYSHIGLLNLLHMTWLGKRLIVISSLIKTATVYTIIAQFKPGLIE